MWTSLSHRRTPFRSGAQGIRCRSPDGAAADVYVVDADGARVESGMAQHLREGDGHVYELRLPSDHFAVLVKRGE